MGLSRGGRKASAHRERRSRAFRRATISEIPFSTALASGGAARYFKSQYYRRTGVGQVQDLDKALADIVAIRTQIARDTAFRGLGSATLAATGVIALATAAGQALWLGDLATRPGLFFGLWIAAALVASALVGFETLRRTRQLHSGLADAMVLSAIEVFLPSAGAGACLGLVIARFAPDSLWLLPGLWQVLVGLGLFASARILPRAVQGVGAWYLLAGLMVIAIAAETRTLSPWTMGLPFVIGQMTLALIVQRTGGADADR